MISNACANIPSVLCGKAGWRGEVRTLEAIRKFFTIIRLGMGAGVFILVATSSGLQGQSGSDVDLVLVLALDCSSSVDDEEFALQRDGLAQAFRSQQVAAAIQDGTLGRIAVAVVQWSGFREHDVTLDWQVVHDRASALSLADGIAQMRRRYRNGATSISHAIKYSTAIVRTGRFTSARRVIDISGDGKNNVNEQPGRTRDQTVAAGVTINGLAILNRTADLDDYYRKNVIGGPNSFLITAKDFEAYLLAIKKKLLREIAEPAVS